MRFLTAAGAAVLVSTLAACGVKQGSLDDQMTTMRDEMRNEMQEGDQRVAAAANQRIDSLARRVDALERDLEAFRREFNAQISQVRGMLRFNVPVYFAFDEATVREEDKPLLDRFANVVKDHYSGSTVTVEGFADPAGSAEYNTQLGMRRANAVKDYLTGMGVTSDMVRAVSYGEAQNRQLRPGATGPGRSGLENRRVALVIDYAGEPTTTTAQTTP
jgi:peptidoglycan-associated lipoprotein